MFNAGVTRLPPSVANKRDSRRCLGSLLSGLYPLQMSSDRTSNRYFESSPIGSTACNVEDHGPNNHLTLIYETPEEQFSTAIPFVQQGLEQGEKCFYVVDDNSVETVVEEMQKAGIDVENAVQSDMLSIKSASDIYLEDGEFAPEEIIEFLRETVVEAVDQEGFEHVRITGEMTWVLNGETHFDALTEYEVELNRFYSGKSITGLCQYNRNRFPAQILHDVIRTHPQIVYENTLSQNFFYNPPSSFFEEDPVSDIDQRVETVLRQARAEHKAAEYERGLAALTETSREMLDATVDDVTTYAVRNVEKILDSAHAAICEYDTDEESLRTRTAVHDEATFDPERYDDELWEAFVTNEPRVIEDIQPNSQNTGVSSLLAVPIGRHGVLAVGSSETAAFDGTDLDFAETVAANVHASLDRAERNEILNERERTVDEQNETIDQQTRVTELVRDTAQIITEASTQADIGEAVCNRLSHTEPFRFVWFGNYNVSNGDLSPENTAGISRDYLDSIELSTTQSDVAEPSVRAAQTRSAQVVEDVFSQTPTTAWQQEAFRRDFLSVLSIPVTYEDVLYGVLTIYADETDAFGELERTVLSELGDTIGFALNAVEHKQALVDDRVVELELRFGDPEFEPIDFARETGAKFDLHGVVPKADGFRVFAALQNCSVEEMKSYVANSLVVESASVVTKRENGLLVEYSLHESGLVPKLLAHGAKPESITADEEDAEVVVSIPNTKDASAFLEMLRRNYSDVELLAKQTRDQGPETVEQFQSELEETLTPRQQETLRTAYYGGYFDWPRTSTGEEIAEQMDVSQPTFNRHLREGSRKLFWKLFEESSSS